MEDPWGSPWAADSPTKIELPAAPQIAHFSANNLFPRRNSRSPAPSRSPGFEDDDAWGGWNGGGADGSASGKESPGWGRSPGLKPLQTAPSVRSLSPDPWKEVTLQRLDTTTLENEERKPRARRASETSGDGRVVDSAISLGEGHQLQREDNLKSKDPAVVPSLDIDATEDAWGVEVTPEAPAPDGIPAIQLEQPDSSPVVEIPVIDVRHEVHDKEPDEPLFAADEHVQTEDAIEIANGFEQKEEQPIAAVEAIDDAAVVPDPEGDQLPPPIKDETVTETQHQRQEPRDEIPESPAVNETEELKSPSTTLQYQPAEQDTPWVLKDLGISYPVDLAKLDDLFPSTPAIATEAELVPDVIIDDTFASSSERKAWYRISRFGSKRKHDLGDDDNYIRVGWSGSQIRERTTQTVRRWMEEDSITGRVVLGRRLGGSGAVMFNWNATAPVEIGEFLGRHSRNSSMTVKSAAPSPTASSFGWASSVPPSPAVARHPLANAFQNLDEREAQSPKEPEEPKIDLARQSLALEPPPLHRGHIPTPIKIPPTLPIDQDEDGDNDWGEMMTATPIDSPSFTEDEGSFGSNRNSIDPQSAFQFETVFDTSKVASPKMEKASKRPLSWHLGQTLAKPFKRGAKTPSTPLFPSPLSKPMTPPQATPTRHAHTMSAGASPLQYSPVRLSLSAEDEETVAKLLRDIPDLTYMLR